MLEWLRRVVGEKKPGGQWLVPVVFWVLAFALLLQPIAALGADPAASPGAAKSSGATESETPAPDPERTEAEAAQEEEAALKDELLEQERPEPEDRPAPAIDPEGWSYQWKNGSDLVRNDGRYELLFGGQVQYEGAVFHLDDGLKQTEERGWNSDSDFRRLRAYVQGFAFDHLMFKASYDFEDEDVKDLYAGIRGLGPLGAVQAGYMKEPFSLEQAMSLRYTTFLERSLANALAPSRNTGVLATSTHFDRRLRWAAGIFFLDESLAEVDDSLEGVENDWEIAARVNWVPVSSEDGSRLVMVGCSYSHIFSDASGLTIGQRPESRLVPKLIKTPEIAGISGGDRFGVELAWLEGSLSVQAEAIGLNIHRDSRLLRSGHSGEAMRRSPTSSPESVASTAARPVCFGRVIPQNPFRPSKRQWGAFQLAARVSMLDLNDADIRGGQELNFTLGLNWYLLANLRLSDQLRSRPRLRPG